MFEDKSRARPKTCGVTAHANILRNWLSGRKDILLALGPAVFWSRAMPPAHELFTLLDLAQKYLELNAELCFNQSEIIDAIQYLHGGPEGPMFPNCMSLTIDAKNATTIITRLIARFRELSCPEKLQSATRKATPFHPRI